MATQFQTQDADGQTFDIAAGQAFQTFWEMRDGQRVAEVISHPWNALDLYGAEDLGRFCITSTTTPDPPTPLPTEVPMYRVKIVLAQQGLTAGVTAYLAGLTEPEKTIAQTLWDGAPNLVVQGAFALQVKAAMGLSDDQYAALVQAAMGLDL